MKSFIVVKGLLLCGLILSSSSAFAFSWAPINPAELKMTEEPKAPGAQAIILELQIDRDDSEHKMSVYKRIKILTDEGRKYGDIEIPYEKGDESVRYIEARTILPDGRVIEFDGTIYDKVIIKGKGVRYQAKTLTLPQVTKGAIVECRFVQYYPYYFYANSRWVLRDELFIKHAKFSLYPNNYYGMHVTWPRGLPPGTEPPKEKNGFLRTEVRDVLPFDSEDYMPPELELKYRVDFVYNTLRVDEHDDPTKYWQQAAKKFSEYANDFMDKRKAMEQVVSKLVAVGDSPEVKLRKIYSHVQQLRNLSFEKDKTEQEQKRDKIKEIENVADIEKFGYGDAFELTYLFVALSRAAGFQADAVLISTRDKYFFDPNTMNPGQLTSNAAVVNLDGKEIFLDPGIPNVPFGMLPWVESGVSGIRLVKNGGVWIKTPMSKPEQALATRKAVFTVEGGDLVGEVVVTYTGLEAIYRRLSERFDDDAARKEYLEDELRQVIPADSVVKLKNSPDWNGVDSALVAEYTVKISGWVTEAGKRQLLPIGIFGGDEKHVFEHEKRIHPIYFHYPGIVKDDISVELPAGLVATSLPSPRDENISVTTFSSDVQAKENRIAIKRMLSINGVFVPEKYYLALRDFYQIIRANDEEQIVLTTTGASNSSKSSAKK